MVAEMDPSERWVLLAYRLPRVPSTPRSMVWRKLRQLGAVQLGDGLVALPADARTREQLEWVAEEVTENGGEATVWLGWPLDPAAASAMVARMTAAVAVEYEAVAAAAAAAAAAETATRRRVMGRLRRQLHRIESRDYFPSPRREDARRAVEELAAADPVEVPG